MLPLPTLKVEFLPTVAIICFTFIGSNPSGHEDDSYDGRKGPSKMFTKLWGSYPWESCISVQKRAVHCLFCSHNSRVSYIYEALFRNASCRNGTESLMAPHWQSYSLCVKRYQAGHFNMMQPRLAIVWQTGKC